LSPRGIRVFPERVTAIEAYPVPTNLRTLRRFLGMAGFNARLIPHFSKCAAILHNFKKKCTKFEWTPQNEGAFESLKRALSHAPVLQFQDFESEFILVTDASNRVI
jgi:hypothetical protein